VNRQTHEQPAQQGKVVRRALRKPTAKEQKINRLIQAIFRLKDEKPTPEREAKLSMQFADPRQLRIAMNIPEIKAVHYAILAEEAQARAEDAAEAAKRAGYSN
jgi:hypothetical protein